MKSLVVSTSDIEAALVNSVALALRDVKLHAPGVKDFRDVGGLEDVKKILIESMNWPSQVSYAPNLDDCVIKNNILVSRAF